MVGWEFYFEYYEVDDMWSKDLSNNSVQRLEILYI